MSPSVLALCAVLCLASHTAGSDNDASQTLDVAESIRQLRAEINNLKTKVNTHVMFLAYYHTDAAVAEHNVVKFDRVITNIGGG